MKYLNKSMFSIAALLFGMAQTPAIAETANDGASIDKVLNELTKQHENASSLVKSSRQPTSLALNSSLIKNRNTSLAPKDNMIDQLSLVASKTVSKFKQSGMASWYGRQFHGQKTASGETFDMNALTAAHPTLPLNCYVKVTNKDNGKSVIVKVNDRSSLQDNKILDLSYGAAKILGITQKGVGNVSIERVDAP